MAASRPAAMPRAGKLTQVGVIEMGRQVEHRHRVDIGVRRLEDVGPRLSRGCPYVLVNPDVDQMVGGRCAGG